MKLEKIAAEAFPSPAADFGEPRHVQGAEVQTAAQLAGAIGTVFVSTIVASAQAIDPAHMANATAAGTQQAFLLVVVFAAAEAVCAALIFGAFKNRTRSVR